MELFKRWAAEHGAAGQRYFSAGDYYLAAFHFRRAYHFAAIWLAA